MTGHIPQTMTLSACCVDRVHFSNESIIYLSLMGNVMLSVKLGKRLNPKCVKKSVKGGGGSVWGMFAAAEVGPLIQLHGRVNANDFS